MERRKISRYAKVGVEVRHILDTNPVPVYKVHLGSKTCRTMRLEDAAHLYTHEPAVAEQEGAMKKLFDPITSVPLFPLGFHNIAPTGRPNEYYGAIGGKLYRFNTETQEIETLDRQENFLKLKQRPIRRITGMEDD